MGTITVTTYGADPQTVNAANLNALVTPIVTECNGKLDNTNLAADAGIVDTKLGTISTAGKVEGGALTELDEIPSGAGIIPVANLGSGTPSAATALLGDGSWGTFPAADGMVVQVVTKTSTTATSADTVIALDNSKPQISEGTEILSQAFTPKSATNILRIDISIPCTTVGTARVIGALFVGSTADSLAAATEHSGSDESLQQLNFTYTTVAGSTDARTYTVRVGTTSGTIYVNKTSAIASSVLGGLSTAYMIITEIKAS